MYSTEFCRVERLAKRHSSQKLELRKEEKKCNLLSALHQGNMSFNISFKIKCHINLIPIPRLLIRRHTLRIHTQHPLPGNRIRKCALKHATNRPPPNLLETVIPVVLPCDGAPLGIQRTLRGPQIAPARHNERLLEATLLITPDGLILHKFKFEEVFSGTLGTAAHGTTG